MARVETRQFLEAGRVGRFPLYFPMMPTAVARPPAAGGQWRFEPKWDGFRALAYFEAGRTCLISRNGIDFSRTFQDLADLHRQFDGDMVVDGEVLALDAGGRPDFQAVQNRLRGERAGTLSYVAFDLLQVGDLPLLGLALEERRSLLERHAQPGGRMAWSPIFSDGAALFGHAMRLGLEGIVAKRLGSPYRPGTRTRDWLKVRIRPHVDALIAGWTEGALGWDFGSLVLAMRGPHGEPVYVGNVGTGFAGPVIADLLARLRPLEQAEPTVAISRDLSSWERRRDTPIHWVRPELVCEVEFSDWTRDGILRQPSYRGLRPDIHPEACRLPSG